MSAYFLLALAILCELVGTTALKLSVGMSRLGPSVVVGLAYAASFWLMAVTLKTLPVGLVYAVWSAAGIAGAKAVGILRFGETLDRASVVGLGLIVGGVLVLTLGTSRTPGS